MPAFMRYQIFSCAGPPDDIGETGNKQARKGGILEAYTYSRYSQTGLRQRGGDWEILRGFCRANPG